MDQKKTSTYLTDRFFAVFGIMQIIAVLSFLDIRFLYAYFAVIAITILLIYNDHSSLIKSKDIQANLNIDSHLDINQVIEASVYITSHRPLTRVSSLNLISPNSQRIRWDKDCFQCILEKETPFSSTVSLRGLATQLGFEQLNELQLSMKGKWRLLYSRVFITIAPCEYRVHPEIHDLTDEQSKQFIRSQDLLIQGSRLSLRERSVDQFHSIREYRYPDPLNHIDQKKLAKYGQPMTRVYEGLRSEHLVIALDLGRNMLGEISGSEKYNYYISACLSLARHGLENGDTVSFVAFADQIRVIIPATRSFESFQILFHGDERLRPGEHNTEFNLLIPLLSSIASKRSLVFLMTDLTAPSIQDTLLTNLSPLFRRHLLMTIGLIDQQYYLKDLILNLDNTSLTQEKLSRFLYSYWVEEQFLLFQKQIQNMGGLSLKLPENLWMTLIIHTYQLLRNSMRV